MLCVLRYSSDASECVVNRHKIVLSPVVGGLEGVFSSGALFQRTENKCFAKQGILFHLKQTFNTNKRGLHYQD